MFPLVATAPSAADPVEPSSDASSSMGPRANADQDTYAGAFENVVSANYGGDGAIWYTHFDRTGDITFLVPNASVDRVVVTFEWDDPVQPTEWNFGVHPPCDLSNASGPDPRGTEASCVRLLGDWVQSTSPATLVFDHDTLFPWPGVGHYLPHLEAPYETVGPSPVFGANANPEIRWEATVHFD